MLNVHSAASPAEFFVDRITGKARIYDLSCKETKETRIFWLQTSPLKTEYIVLFCDVTLDNGRTISGGGEISIIKEEFDKLEINDNVEIGFEIRQNFGEPRKLYPLTLKFIDREGALDLS
jgi:hypothetical protein